MDSALARGGGGDLGAFGTSPCARGRISPEQVYEGLAIAPLARWTENAARSSGSAYSGDDGWTGFGLRIQNQPHPPRLNVVFGHPVYLLPVILTADVTRLVNATDNFPENRLVVG